jgi:4-hydroxyphenylpyruvate dioxygenase
VKTSIATVSIAGSLPEKLEAIAAAGFDGVEIFENDFLAFDASPREVGRMVRDAGLEITLFQPFRDFEGMPEPQRSRAFDRAERKFEVMQELGTNLMLVCSNVSTIALGGIARAADDFRELGERAARHGIRVGYEALAWGRHINDHRDAWEIVRRADHPNVGLILDSFHTLARKIDVQSIRAIPGDRIFIVQLADAPAIGMDLLYWSRHFRNMPGEGDLPVVDFMSAVAATGYDGPLSLEIFNDQFRGGSPKLISVDGRRSLVYLMDRVRRQEPGISIAAPEMPDRSHVRRVEFVEFAASPTEAKALTDFLGLMGFAAVARHRSKAVTLYRQGEINLLVNTEEEGFAYSSFVVHGTSAYAVALRVDDAMAARERAVQLGAEAFSQPAGPGELNIPAIVDVGGGLVYFVDDKSNLGKLWDIDFEPLPQEAGLAPTGLLSVDHLAQTVKADEFLSWLLFYTSNFEMTKAAQVDVVDPAGLVRSQAVAGPDGRFRVTLNGAENRRTLAGHFMAESFGSSIQHIAFSTGDIFRTAAALKENGFEALHIAGNYFDDVEARFGLDAELADRLRAFNILYDQDEDGEYFQFYSPVFGEGFFFEIVERRGGYKGYGGPNAPFRIAAQKRHLRPEGMPHIRPGA